MAFQKGGEKSRYTCALCTARRSVVFIFLWTKVAQESLLFSHGACLIHSKIMTSFSLNALVRKSKQKKERKFPSEDTDSFANIGDVLHA